MMLLSGWQMIMPALAAVSLTWPIIMRYTGSGGMTMLTKTMDIQKPPPLKDLVCLAETGTEVVLVEDGKAVARIVPVGKRIPGLHMGEVWMSEDFNAPLPDDFWTGKA